MSDANEVPPPPGWYADPDKNPLGHLRWWDGSAWSEHLQPSSASTQDARKTALQKAVSANLGYGVVVESQDEYQAVLRKDPPQPNHVMHAIVSLLTCGLWLFVWLFIALWSPPSKRLVLTVDESGVVSERLM